MHQVPSRIPPLRLLSAERLLLLLLVFSSGCGVTDIPAPAPLSASYARLGQLGETEMPFVVLVPAELVASVGHQYLLALPIASIRTASLQELLADELYRGLAERGWRPNLVKIDHPHTLRARVTDIQLSAYDYVLRRRLTCRFTLELNSGAGIHRSYTAQVEMKSWEEYGFAEQLQHLLRSTVRSAVDEGLTQLQLDSAWK